MVQAGGSSAEPRRSTPLSADTSTSAPPSLLFRGRRVCGAASPAKLSGLPMTHKPTTPLQTMPFGPAEPAARHTSPAHKERQMRSIAGRLSVAAMQIILACIAVFACSNASFAQSTEAYALQIQDRVHIVVSEW